MGRIRILRDLSLVLEEEDKFFIYFYINIFPKMAGGPPAPDPDS